MSARTSSSRRPTESDVYTCLLILAFLFLTGCCVAVYIPIHDWYDFGKGELAEHPPVPPAP